MSRQRLPAALLDTAANHYRSAGRFAWKFARGKLNGDPVFAGLLAGGWIAPQSRILDLGCGQGLLASLLLAVDEAVQKNAWPAQWPATPVGCKVHGIELMPRDVERAHAALGAHAERFKVEQGDITQAEFPPSDAVVILDVLHYIPYAAQEDVLQRVRNCLPSGGKLLLRVGDKAGGLAFHFSNWVDAVVFRIRGHASATMYCRTAADWKSLLEKIGFDADLLPMNAGTPFASMLLVAHKRSA